MDGSEENYAEKFKYALLSKRERARYPVDAEFAECSLPVTDWPRMTKFHVDASKGLYLAFKEPLEQYFSISI